MFIDEEIPNNLIQLLSIDNKSDLKKYCTNLTITKDEFVTLIINSHKLGYHYVSDKREYIPEHLIPSKKELDEVEGKLDDEYGELTGLGRKVHQVFKDRKILVIHFFIKYDNPHCWHIFYFDQRDIDKHDNHWSEGPHIHLKNHLTIEKTDIMSNLDELLKFLEDFLEKPKISIKNSLHIKFINHEYET